MKRKKMKGTEKKEKGHSRQSENVKYVFTWSPRRRGEKNRVDKILEGLITRKFPEHQIRR